MDGFDAFRRSSIGAIEHAAKAFADDPPAVPEDRFPHDAFACLHATGLLAAPLPVAEGGAGLGATPGTTAALLRVLAAIGCADLSVGRIYEGHCNALQLIRLYGSAAQKSATAAAVLQGRIFAVWNTDDPASHLVLRDKVLHGAKVFCSGAGDVTPLATAWTPDGHRQLCIVSPGTPGVSVDLSGWTPLGMAASTSGRVAFDGVAGELLGAPDDYQREPWFHGGAIRFAAVQLGGAEALLAIAVRHLRAAKRTDDPHQISRMGSIAVAVESGRAWLERAGSVSDSGIGDADKVVHADMTRTAIERICLDTMELATRSIGVAGMMSPHRLERVVRDLATYLRQPAPDATLAEVGRWALADRPGVFDAS